MSKLLALILLISWTIFGYGIVKIYYQEKRVNEIELQQKLNMPMTTLPASSGRIKSFTYENNDGGAEPQWHTCYILDDKEISCLNRED